METDALAVPAAIYARYSSHAQRDVSIEQQIAECEDFARKNNLQVIKVYADRHLSGTTDNRPEFQQMLHDAAHARWRYVVTYKVDRFARNRYDSATYKFRLKKHGIRVLYAKEAIPDGPEGILLEALLEGSAEYYSANLSQNIKRGMRYNALECQVNGGVMPYGYRRGADGRFAINDAEAEVVREIFRKTSEGATFASLCNDLNGRGIRTRRGSLWNKSSFRTMLKNEMYIGVYQFGDVRVEDGVPPIIDKPLFLSVQDRVETKKHVRGRLGGNDEYMLTGKLFCGECGSLMAGYSGVSKGGGKYCYYVCQGRRGGNGCCKKNVPRDWLEDQVVDAALDVVLREDVIEWIADQVMAYQEREANSAQLVALRQSLAETQTAAENVMRAIEAGIITATTKRRLQELEAETARLQNAITLEEASITRIDRDFVVYWLEGFKKGDRSSVEFRRQIIDTFVAAVWVYEDRLRIAFNYSGSRTVDRKIIEAAVDVDTGACSYKGAYAPPKPKSCHDSGRIFFIKSNSKTLVIGIEYRFTGKKLFLRFFGRNGFYAFCDPQPDRDADCFRGAIFADHLHQKIHGRFCAKQIILHDGR